MSSTITPHEQAARRLLNGTNTPAEDREEERAAKSKIARDSLITAA